MNKVFVRFCVLQGAYWSFYAALPGYITAYMLDRGMSAAALGILLAVNLLCAFLGSLFWGRWVDRHQASRRFFLIGNAAAAVLGVLLFLCAGNPALLFVLYPLFGFMTGPIATTLDSWVIASFPERPDAMARSRSFATLSYAFVMLFMGQLITRIGYGVMPLAALIFLAVSLLTALPQPETRRPAEAAETVKADPRQLLSSRIYVLLVAAVFVTGLAIAPINNMKVLVFESVGGDVSFLGWDSFIGCLCQVPFLLFSGKLRRIRAEHRLILSAVMAVLYAALVTVARNPATVIAGTIMTNVNFGVLFPTMREMTERNVSPALRTTAHSVIDVAYGSLAGMISSAWSGAVIQHAGRAAMGAVCVGMGLGAVALTVVILAVSRKGRGAPRAEICRESGLE